MKLRARGRRDGDPLDVAYAITELTDRCDPDRAQRLVPLGSQDPGWGHAQGRQAGTGNGGNRCCSNARV